MGWDLRDRHLEAAHFDGLCGHVLMGDVGHDVFVGADSRWGDFGYVGIGEGREAPVDGPAALAAHSALTSPSALTKAKPDLCCI